MSENDPNSPELLPIMTAIQRHPLTRDRVSLDTVLRWRSRGVKTRAGTIRLEGCQRIGGRVYCPLLAITRFCEALNAADLEHAAV